MTKKPTKSNHQFPEIIAIAREAEAHGKKADDYLWRIGDALVEYCGEPGEPGVKDESRKKMHDVAKELEKEGLGNLFSYSYLRKLRKTAVEFPAGNRLAGVPWTIHDLAGNPEILKEMLEEAKVKNKPLTASFAREFKAQSKIARNIQTQAEGKDDPKKAVLFCIDNATLVKTGAIKLIKLASDMDTRISRFLSEIEQRDGLKTKITAARDQAVKVVAKLDELLQKVGAGAP